VRARRLAPVFRAIIASVAACSQTSNEGDAGVDASSDATTVDAPNDVVATDAGADVPIDSYVDWCEAGAPVLLADSGYVRYYDVPCGVPPGDTTDDAGVINRCDQICSGETDDRCAVLPDSWIDVFIDAGLIDAATAETVDAGAVFVICACSSIGGRRPEGLAAPELRRTNPIGDWFSHLSHLERASIIAFARLGDELAELGASRGLLRRAARARIDERGHARVTARLAKRFGGAVARTRIERTRKRAIEEIAIENAVEGCVRETFGALVATWQSENAGDADVRAAFEGIARDETRHAELAHAVAQFLEPQLDDVARDRIARATNDAFDALERDARNPVDSALIDVAGLPDAKTTQQLVAELRAQLTICARDRAHPRRPRRRHR